MLHDQTRAVTELVLAEVLRSAGKPTEALDYLDSIKIHETEWDLGLLIEGERAKCQLRAGNRAEAAAIIQRTAATSLRLREPGTAALLAAADYACSIGAYEFASTILATGLHGVHDVSHLRLALERQCQDALGSGFTAAWDAGTESDPFLLLKQIADGAMPGTSGGPDD